MVAAALEIPVDTRPQKLAFITHDCNVRSDILYQYNAARK
jgi:hypothetical protein